MYWLIFWCMLTVGVGLVPGSAVAQVSMEARLGLQGAVRLGKLNVVTVQVHNPGGPLAGTLGVRTWLGSEARGDFHVTTFARAVELPPGARKRFTFAVPITSTADPVEVTLRTGETVLAHVPSHHDHKIGEWIGIRAEVDHVVTFEREAEAAGSGPAQVLDR